MPSGHAINQYIYLRECIQKLLVPFIAEHHSDGEYLFWPDLAKVHNAKIVTCYFTQENINFVENTENPSNVPECRPIEDFCSILKGLVYKDNWQAENIIKLRRRIKNCLKKVDEKLVQILCRTVTRRLDNIRQNNLIENK